MNTDSPKQAPTLERALQFYPSPLRYWLWLKTKVGQMPTDMFIPYMNGRQPDSILEIGCGYGFLSNCLSLEYPNAQVHGIDLNAGRIASAQTSVAGRNNISFKLENAFALPDQQWDCIILVDVIHHVPRDSHQQLITACHKLLKPNGLLIVRDMDPEHHLGKLWFSHVWEVCFYLEVCKMVTIPQMTDFMKHAGFVDINVTADSPKSLFFNYVTYSASRA